MGQLAVMGRAGDTKVIWDPNNADEVEAARAQWDKLVGERKFAAFAVGPKGQKADRLKEFDPSIEKVILVPPMAGG